MIGVFDCGLGGLAVLRRLAETQPETAFVYLGDHANAPYGNRPSEQLVELTRRGVETLFLRGARLVVIASNTAASIATRRLQTSWLPGSGWQGNNVLGIVVPAVETATGTPWGRWPGTAVQDAASRRSVIAVIGATRTITSNVFHQEIRKRLPRAEVLQVISAHLASAIEDDATPEELDGLVAASVHRLLGQLRGAAPDAVILGSAYFSAVEDRFRRALPPSTRVVSQPHPVAAALADYLMRYPHYLEPTRPARRRLEMLTTADPEEVDARARIFWPRVPAFEKVVVS